MTALPLESLPHDAHSAARHDAQAHSHELSFWKRYIFSGDHKIIGVQFLFLGLTFMVLGGLLAMVVRWQLAFPGDPGMPNHPIPILAKYMGWSGGVMPPDYYNMAFSMHATIMIFFVIIPLLVGTFGNYLIPLQIGAADMAFPFLNGFAFWFAVPAGAIILAGFTLPGGHAQTGWTSYPPLSALPLTVDTDKTNPYIESQSAAGKFFDFLRIGRRGFSLDAGPSYVDGRTYRAFLGDRHLMEQAILNAAHQQNLSNVTVNFVDPRLPAYKLDGADPKSWGVGVKIGAGNQDAGESIFSAIDKSKPDGGFSGNWPPFALLTTFGACFLTCLYLGAYCVRVGGRTISRLLAVALALVVAWFAVRGIQYAAFDGQSCWFLSLIILGFSSILGAVNYLATIIKLRCPGMTMFRMPLSTWAMFITSILVLLATPVLAGVLTMNLLDHHGLTSFFEPYNWLNSDNLPLGGHGDIHGGGGYALLHQHLFWFYSHPAVYIMILPAMGMVSDVMAAFCRKPVFGYRPMIYALAGIAFLGFMVWAHHMFQSGMNPTLGTTFAVSTMFIAVPSAIKTFNWLGTMWGANIRFAPAMLNAIGFVSSFVIGGLSGIYMASTAVDVQIHATYFIVAHIHYVLFGGSLFGLFAAIYYWYPKMFGRMMNAKVGVAHFFLTFITFNLTFFPMHILGIAGMPRRVADPSHYEMYRHFQPLNRFISYSAFALGLSQLLFVFNFLGSLIWGKRAPSNPWEANTLEWTDAPSPPPHGNFLTVPIVHRGPYEYSSPLVGEDWLPQSRYLGEAPQEPAVALAH